MSLRFYPIGKRSFGFLEPNYFNLPSILSIANNRKDPYIEKRVYSRSFVKVWVLFLIWLNFSSLCAEDLSQTYTFPKLTEVHYEGFGRFEIHQSNQNTCILKGDQTLLDQVEISYQNGTLWIRSNVPNHDETFTVVLQVAHLHKLLLSGDVVVDIDTIKGEDLMIEMGRHGTPLVEGYIDYKRLFIAMYGETRSLLKGKVKDLMVYIEGAGVYRGELLEAANGNIWIQGLGKACVHIKQILTISTLGWGRVEYAGNPKTIKRRGPQFQKEKNE